MSEEEEMMIEPVTSKVYEKNEKGKQSKDLKKGAECKPTSDAKRNEREISAGKKRHERREERTKTVREAIKRKKR